MHSPSTIRSTPLPCVRACSLAVWVTVVRREASEARARWPLLALPGARVLVGLRPRHPPPRHDALKLLEMRFSRKAQWPRSQCSIHRDPARMSDPSPTSSHPPAPPASHSHSSLMPQHSIDVALEVSERSRAQIGAQAALRLEARLHSNAVAIELIVCPCHCCFLVACAALRSPLLRPRKRSKLPADQRCEASWRRGHGWLGAVPCARTRRTPQAG